MERIKKPIADNEGIFKHIFDNAMGNPIILQKEPTSPGDLKANTWGSYGGKLYVRFGNGKLYSFNGTEIT